MPPLPKNRTTPTDPLDLALGRRVEGFPLSPRRTLYYRGLERLRDFCRANSLPSPAGVNVLPESEWRFRVCAYYRPESGINLCLEKCALPCPEAMSRLWSWPGSSVDRTPYGVLAHELGHHVDWHESEVKERYYGNYSYDLCRHSGEPSLTGYGVGEDHEWFAEMFRLFVTNHALLRWLRPRTWALLVDEGWEPVGGNDWVEELGPGVPDRVVRALERKGRKR